MIEKKIEEEQHKIASEKNQNYFLKQINRLNMNNTSIAYVSVGLMFVFLLSFIYGKYLYGKLNLENIKAFFDYKLLIYISIGFMAQVVDGALGMAYGAVANSLLIGLGINPVSASAGIHFAEIFTTGASGLSHLKLGNVNKKLFIKLLLPGILGAGLGASLLALKINGEAFKPYVSLYVMFLGILFLRKALLKKRRKKKTKYISILALGGGFLDSVGGGGWGPIVTSTLLNQGRSFVYTIGSVNLAEFFVAFASSFTFLFFIDLDDWKVIVGLIIGGIFAAPFAAILIRKINQKKMMTLVGIIVIILSIFNFIINIK